MKHLSPDQISDVIQMALSDHISFEHIQQQYGLREKEVKTLMRNNLRRGSYQAWRKRVRDFGSRRSFYK
ncbi:TIGR03643 family protein [Rhodobacteraceae bacterium]|nr:TIGR03643 family protein [Paracoccaceae bacterium]